jgi:hypothetical protein
LSERSTESGGREERLQAVLHEYLQAVDAGRRPDREELLRRHPELASELKAFFADQERLDRAARHAAPGAAYPAAGAANRRRRPVGHGALLRGL